MTDARALTHCLGGQWRGRYGTANCPAHPNTRTPALSLSDGNDGRLLAYCHAGCDFASVAAALRGIGLLEVGGTIAAPDPAVVAARRAAERAAAEKRAAQALALWREAQPVGGTPAETYLRGRGITCPLPDMMRQVPSCWHASARHCPALVARVDGVEGFAVHRTYLRADGSGKADLDPPKAMLGSVMGDAVRLVEGPGPLVVAEGIETALSLPSGLLRSPARVWAALSTSGLRGLRLPTVPGRLTVAGDGENAGREAAHALAERAHGLGWRVSLLPAPEGRDWNDVLTGKAVAS